MAQISNEDLKRLSTLIVLKIQEEFAIKHLSKNLIDTIRIEYLGDTININIPAEIYDMWEYKRTKVVRYTGNGSYASSLDENSKNHTGYIERAIKKAIDEWKTNYRNATIKMEDL